MSGRHLVFVVPSSAPTIPKQCAFQVSLLHSCAVEAVAAETGQLQEAVRNSCQCVHMQSHSQEQISTS